MIYNFRFVAGPVARVGPCGLEIHPIVVSLSRFCSWKQTAVVRASDDFWPRDPASHTIHIASVAYNSLFLGEFMQPDWDMFQVSFFTFFVRIFVYWKPNGIDTKCSKWDRLYCTSSCHLCQTTCLLISPSTFFV